MVLGFEKRNASSDTERKVTGLGLPFKIQSLGEKSRTRKRACQTSSEVEIQREISSSTSHVSA